MRNCSTPEPINLTEDISIRLNQQLKQDRDSSFNGRGRNLPFPVRFA